MVKKNSGILILLFFFGLPFLSITDLFPLHRFGMFARLPVSALSEFHYEIQIKKDNTWQRLNIGNAYIDQNYLPIWANRAFHDLKFRTRLSVQIRKNLGTPTDSIRVFFLGEKPNQTQFLTL